MIRRGLPSHRPAPGKPTALRPPTPGSYGWRSSLPACRWLSKLLRAALHALEGSPLRALGLSHVWVLEKVEKEKG